jgi:gas vesicle protein
MNKAFKRIALGTLVAGAAGYIAGLLTAPKSGRATREDIKTATDNTISKTERELKKLHTELNELLSESKKRGTKVQGKAREEYQDVTEMAVKAKQKARELLSALHEGDADNKDLQRAMTEASKAIKHLRAFLKK